LATGSFAAGGTAAEYRSTGTTFMETTTLAIRTEARVPVTERTSARPNGKMVRLSKR